jgi:hypothetical protein
MLSFFQDFLLVAAKNFRRSKEKRNMLQLNNNLRTIRMIADNPNSIILEKFVVIRLIRVYEEEKWLTQ